MKKLYAIIIVAIMLAVPFTASTSFMIGDSQISAATTSSDSGDALVEEETDDKLPFEPTYVEKESVETEDGIQITILDNQSVRIDKFPEGYLLKDKNDVSKGYDTTLTIPSEITYDGKKYVVISISGDAGVKEKKPVNQYVAPKQHSITKVVIPDTVQRIEDAVRSAVGNVYSPNAWDTVFGYGSLQTVEFGKNLTYIGNGVFKGSHLEELTIPDQVEFIGDLAFSGLKNVKLGTSPDASKLQYVGDGAFNNLVESAPEKPLIIPKSLTHIGTMKPFGNAELDFSNNTNFTINNDLILKDNGKTIATYVGTATDVTIAEGIEIIGDYAFALTDVSSVTLPKSLIKIGEGAFFSAKNLEYVKYTDSSLKQIGDKAFSFESSKKSLKQFGTTLNKLSFPNTLESIGYVAFAGVNNLGEPSMPNVDSLKEITAIEFGPDGGKNCLEYIGKYAFYGFPKLTKVDFNSSDASVSGVIIDDFAFACNDIVQKGKQHGHIAEVSFDATSTEQDSTIFKLSKIGMCAFGLDDRITDSRNAYFHKDPVSLTTFGDVPNAIKLPWTLEYLGDAAFTTKYALPELSVINGNFDVSKSNMSNKNIQSIVIGDPVNKSKLEYLGDAAFARLTYGTEIDLSNCVNLNLISDSAFAVMAPGIQKSLEDNSYIYSTIKLPLGLKEIGDFAFCNIVVKSIDLPASMEKIGKISFGDDCKTEKFIENCSFGGNLISFGMTPFGAEDIPNNMIVLKSNVVNSAFEVKQNTQVIDRSIFSSGMDITNITVAAENTRFSADAGSLYSTMGEKTLLRYFGSSDIYKVPADVKKIDSYAIISDKLVVIDLTSESLTVSDKAINGCDNVKTIVLSDISKFSDKAVEKTNAYVFKPIGCPTSESDLNVFGTYSGEIIIGTVTLYPVVDISGELVSMKDVVTGQGTISFKLDISGWYTANDVSVRYSEKDVVSDNETYSITVETGKGIFYIQALDRSSADTVVTIHADGGCFYINGNESVDPVEIKVPKGMTILESEMIVPYKNVSTIKGWFTDESYSTPFDLQEGKVDSALNLYPQWVDADPLIVFESDHGSVTATCSGQAFASGDRTNQEVTLEFVADYGYELKCWQISSHGQETTTDNSSVLKYTASNDTVIRPILRTYSGAELIPIIESDGPTSFEDLNEAWAVGGYVDTSHQAWKGLTSTPLIVDDHTYVRISDKIYMIDNETGYISKFVTSKATDQFYHYLGYGNGTILDYTTHKAYSLDLTEIYTMPAEMTSATYHDGFFYGPTDKNVVKRFSAEDVPGQVETKTVDSTWESNVKWYGQYGQSSRPVFADGYMYYLSHDGESRSIVSVSLTSSADHNMIVLDRISNHMYDDGWLSYYDGMLYLSSYPEGLFGSVSAYGDAVVSSVPISKGVFGEPKYTELSDDVFKGAKSLCSEFVVFNGNGYINISGGSQFGAKSFLAVYDLDTMELLREIETDRSHGSIVLNTANFNDTGEVFIYLVPYDGRPDLMIIKDDGAKLSLMASKTNSTFNSQAVRADSEGSLYWYSDDGWVKKVTTSDKNPYYVFFENGTKAEWIKIYGNSFTDALKKSNLVSISDDGRILSARMTDELNNTEGWKSYALMGTGSGPEFVPHIYDWKEVANNYIGADEFRNAHHWVITKSQDAASIGTTWYYNGSNTYTFSKNMDEVVTGFMLYKTQTEEYAVSVNETENGIASVHNPTMAAGSIVDVVTGSNFGYEIDTVSYVADSNSVNVVKGDDGRYTFQMPAHDVVITVTFKEAPFDVNIIDGLIGGTVDTDKQMAMSGDTVTVTVTSDLGYEYKAKSMVCTTSSGEKIAVSEGDTITFTMPFDHVTLSCEFSEKSYKVTEVKDNGTATFYPSGSAKYKQTVYIYGYTIKANSGYEFKGIEGVTETGDNIEIKKGGPGYSFTMPAANVTISVIFEKIPVYTVTVNDAVNGVVKASVSESIAGKKIILTATPDTGYSLEDINCRTASGTYVPITVQNGQRSFVMPAENVTVSASFGNIPTYNVSISEGISNGKIESYSAAATAGSDVIFMVSPDKGYKLGTVECKTASGQVDLVAMNDGLYKFNMPAEDVSLSATFVALSADGIAYQIDSTASTSGSNTILDLSIQRTSGETNINDAHLLVIAKYGGGVVVNVYSDVELADTGTGISKVVVSSSGLEEVIVEMVSGIPDAPFDNFGHCSYKVNSA